MNQGDLKIAFVLSVALSQLGRIFSLMMAANAWICDPLGPNIEE